MWEGNANSPIPKGTPFLQCTIEGREIQFQDHLQAYIGKEGDLEIRGVCDAFKTGEHLSITLPKFKKGTYNLRNTRAMRLKYSRSMLSSNSADHFGTSVDGSIPQLKETIYYLDLKEGWIEGTFSATAHSFPSGKISITDGVFKMPIIEKQQTNNVPLRQTDPLEANLISEKAFALTLEPIPRDGIITEFRLALK